MKNAIINTILPDEVRMLKKRIDKVTLLNLNETSMELDGELTDEIKESIVGERNKMMGHCLSSIIRLEKWVKKLGENND